MFVDLDKRVGNVEKKWENVCMKSNRNKTEGRLEKFEEKNEEKKMEVN